MEFPHLLVQFPNTQKAALTLFFTPRSVINAVQQGQFLVPFTPPLVPVQAHETEHMKRTSFTEISTFKEASLIIFPEDEDKKYVHLCTISLLKIFFDLRSTINSVIAKSAVVMTPILGCSQFPLGASSFSHSNFFTPMTQTTSFVVGNTGGVNNENFRQNFRELLTTHNSCLVALLETKLHDHFEPFV